MDDELGFLPESDLPAGSASSPVWRVLAVDDDPKFQRSLAFALANMELMGRSIELVQAYSMAEAAALLGQDPHFAVVLVDVVMETEDAGLRLIKAVREILGVSETRFILLTGQPGMAPAESVMQDYDLSDYVLKSDLATRGIRNILTAAVRNYHQLKTISAARRGLQLIVESSNRLLGIRNLSQIASATLSEIATLINVPDEGLVCVNRAAAVGLAEGTEEPEPITITASGRFRPYINRALRELPDSEVQTILYQALLEKAFVGAPEGQVLFFSKSAAISEFAIYVATGRQLTETEMELLHVFAANVSRGFGNVALISKLDRVAYQDELLGIPNRSAILRELARLNKLKDASMFRLVLLDLDHFSGFNNLFGSGFGDAVLKAVAARLSASFPQPTVIGRLHSDLFAIIGHADSVNLHAAQQMFEQPFDINQSSHNLSACLTAMSLTAGEDDASSLLRSAVTTLRIAKAHGAGSVQPFDSEFERQASERFDLMQKLVTAIREQQFILHYQPQVDLQTGEVVGVEALIRWQSDEGMISPGVFIPLAEQSAYIHCIGDIVVNHACQAVQRLNAEGFEKMLVSVNYSARQLERADVFDRLRVAYEAAGIERKRLCLEVTETAMMQSFHQVAALLEQHRTLGGTVAIDDFGTGMSSLEYLLELPADHLKIDIAFVSRLDKDERSRSLVRMIIALGKRLGISVVAEGVETEQQANWLRDNGCNVGQGWLFGRPMPLEDLIQWLHKRQQGER